MIGINRQCEMCRHLRSDSDGGQQFYYCEQNLILDEGEKRDCPEFEYDICLECGVPDGIYCQKCGVKMEVAKNDE